MRWIVVLISGLLFFACTNDVSIPHEVMIVQNYSANYINNIEIFVDKISPLPKAKALLKTFSIKSNSTVNFDIKISEAFLQSTSYFKAVIKGQTDTLTIGQSDPGYYNDLGEFRKNYFYIDATGKLVKEKPTN
jgi:hypothetical protein